MARSMLSEYNVSNSFWAETINTACHASNRLYCHRFHNKTPYELLIGRKPKISYFRVFCWKCYILRKRTRLSKSLSKVDEGFCRRLTAKLSKVYPEEIDCRQGLAKIRTRWCKEHKDLDRFRPLERNTLRPVCGLYSLRCCSMFLRGLCPPLYSLGGQSYMESPNRVLLESSSNIVG